MNNYVAELDKLDQTVRQKEAEKIRAEERVRTGEAKLAEIASCIEENSLTPENIGQAIAVLDQDIKDGLAKANAILDGKDVQVLATPVKAVADPEFDDEEDMLE